MYTDVVNIHRTVWPIRTYNLTMRGLVNLAILLCCFSSNATASYCYPDYCRTVSTQAWVPGFQCLLTKVEKGVGCTKLFLDDFNRAAPVRESEKFNLRAYIYEESETKATAFNLSVTNANFRGLVTRYQNLLNKSQSACRYVRFYGNETLPVPKEFYVSCPFYDESYESVPYRLDYLVIGSSFNYSKRYIFNVPVHKFIDQGADVKVFRPFVYIDVSYAPLLSLHIQPLPETYNVTKYRIWLVNNDTNSVTLADIFSTISKQDILYNFTAHTGVFYFKVSPIHTNCGEYGCANSTTPYIIIQKTSHRLLIMIISTVWIPPVILYVLYHLYKLYKKEASKRRGAPKCLLVYAPTRLSHINVMIELAKYLRACNINAMIDMLDVTDTTDQGLEYWCDAAFRSADIVVLATSPPPKKSSSSFIYRNTNNYLLRLLKENRPQRGKRCYIVQLPYCKSDDIPEETRHFKRFSLPKELAKLVKIIHQMERAKCMSSVSDNEFLDSVKIAKLEILEEDTNIVKDRETENLLSLEKGEMPGKPIFLLATSDPAISADARQSFATNIDELNLLGKSEQGEEVRTRSSPTNDAPLFRIDQLNL